MDNKKVVNNWLSKLQQESWNLELLISGFSIFLLIQAGDLLLEQMEFVRAHTQNDSPFIISFLLLMGIAFTASKVLTLNLIVHVIFRGFWIGAIGLRSVQEKIDFERLGYTPFFTEKLRSKVGTLDQLLIRLDTLCSVIFAFTFLIVFMFFSLFLYIFFLMLLFQLLASLTDVAQSRIAQNSLLVILMTFVLTGMIYMFDTLSLGLLKKIKWIKRFYYPIYRFYSFITFSSAYRSIYYSLISRFPKRWIIAIMTPYVLFFSLTPFHKFDYYQFFPDNVTAANLVNNFYDDQRSKEAYIETVSIPSMIQQTD
ncbi:MAG: hypothetical protein AAF985_25235, partial [Bacteroidota bacterium]